MTKVEREDREVMAREVLLSTNPEIVRAASIDGPVPAQSRNSQRADRG